MMHLIDPAVIGQNERKLAALMRGYFRKASMQHGIDAHARGGVEALAMSKDMVEAKVMDGSGFKVSLNLSYLPFSKCNCANKGGCGHIFAVLLKLYEHQGLPVAKFVTANVLGVWPATGEGSAASPIEQASSSRDGRQNGQSVPASRPASPQPKPAGGSGSGRTQAADGSRKQQHVPNAPALASFGEWHRFFRDELPPHQLPRKLGWSGMADKLEHALCKTTERWPDKPLATVYRIHALLYGLHALETAADSNYFYAEHYEREIDRMSDRLIKMITSIQPESLNGKEVYLHYMEGIATMLQRYAFGASRGWVNWLLLFRVIWSRLLVSPTLRSAGRKNLLEEAAHPGLPGATRELMHVAAAHYDFLQSGDEAAIGYVDRHVRHVRPELFYDYIHSLHATKDWERLLRWMRWLLNGMRGASPQNVGGYLDIWKRAAEAIGGAVEWRQAMLDLLPQSLEYYGQYLIDRGEYAMWADVFMAWEKNPAFESEAQLRHVESVAPQVLLPIYHQRVWRQIESKSRTGYEEAAADMKNLQRWYKKLKMDAQWQVFIERIAAQYPRLRALHEVLRKSRLMA